MKSAFFAASSTVQTSKPSASAFAFERLPSCSPMMTEVLRVGVALAAVAEDGYRLAVQEAEICVAVVINLCHLKQLLKNLFLFISQSC